MNIQYLIYEDELYVIEVNPRASRTVPYISKVTGVPMVDLASRVMLGAALADLGYGTGLYRTPPYCAVKVPVFSFEKLTDANSILGPEMKSTGEVLGIGKTMAEALFKGLTAAGFTVPQGQEGRRPGVLLSVEDSDYQESAGPGQAVLRPGPFAFTPPPALPRPLRLWACPCVPWKIRTVPTKLIRADGDAGKISYLIYTGAVKDATMGDYIALHRRAHAAGHSLPDLAGYRRRIGGNDRRAIPGGHHGTGGHQRTCAPGAAALPLPRCSPAATTRSLSKTSTARLPARNPCASPCATRITASAAMASC